MKWLHAGLAPALFLSLSLAIHLGLLAGFSDDSDGSAGYGAIPSHAPQIVSVSLNDTPGRNLPQQDNARSMTGLHDADSPKRESRAGDSGTAAGKRHGMVRQTNDVYIPANALTQRPLVVVDVPPDLTLVVPGVPPQAAVLRLLINEYGDVDNVVIEDSRLPDAAQKKVTEAFSRLRFHPGEIRGTPVKSLLRIEVLLKDPQVTGNEKGR